MPGRYFLTSPLTQVAAHFDAALDASDPSPRRDAAPGEIVGAVVTSPE